MRLSFRYLLCLVILIIFTSIAIPRRYEVNYPKPIGPKLNNYISMKYQDALVKENADMVLIGDSVLVQGVDVPRLSQLIGKKTVGFGIQGSASAVWYLEMKNVIAKSPHKPRFVLIFFRDTILTAPGYRVTGKYFKQIDDLANTDDKVLIQKSYVQLMNPIEKWADHSLPLYGSRLRLRETIDYYIRYSLTNLVGCDLDCNDSANNSIFLDLNLDSNLLVDAIASAESYLYTPDQLNFDAQLNNSFLPDITRIAQEQQIKLILVRTKHLNDPSESTESAALKSYIAALRKYANANDILVLDFAHEERLTSDLFADSHHLLPAGAMIFTSILADALNPIINK